MKINGSFDTYRAGNRTENRNWAEQGEKVIRDSRAEKLVSAYIVTDPNL